MFKGNRRIVSLRRLGVPFLAAITAGCDIGDDPLRPADFSGTWRETLHLVENNCPPEFSFGTMTQDFVKITQTGADVVLDIVDSSCGLRAHRQATVSGSVLEARVYSSGTVGWPYLLCAQRYLSEWTATLDGGRVLGSITNNLSYGGVCPEELLTGSCTWRYSFDWSRCPAADCSLPECSLF